MGSEMCIRDRTSAELKHQTKLQEWAAQIRSASPAARGEHIKQRLIGARSVRAVDGGESLPECLLVCARAVVFHHGGDSRLMPMPVML